MPGGGPLPGSEEEGKFSFTETVGSYADGGWKKGGGQGKRGNNEDHEREGVIVLFIVFCRTEG